MAALLQDIVPEGHWSLSVLIEGVPIASQSDTEDALVGLFSSVGALQRLIIQTVSDGSSQRAIATYKSSASAQAALTLNGTRVLGDHEVRVRSLASLVDDGWPTPVISASGAPSAHTADEDGGSGTGGGGGGEDSRDSRVSQAVAQMLATGISLGERGFAWVVEVDSRLGFSIALNDLATKGVLALGDIGQQLQVRERIGRAATAVESKFGEVDEQLNIRERAAKATEGAKRVSDTAKAALDEAAQRALEKQWVRDGVDAFTKTVEGAVIWGSSTWQMAQDQARAQRTSAEAADGDASEEYGEPRDA